MKHILGFDCRWTGLSCMSGWGAGPRPFVPSEALAYIYPEDAAQAQGERNYRSLDDAQAQANSPGRVCH